MAAKPQIIDVFAQIRDRRTMRRFFNEIFTPSELRDVELRWRLMQMLDDNVPQREIAQRLGISLCKITRGSRILKRRGSVSARLLVDNKKTSP